MAYYREMYYTINTIENEYKWAGHYGRKGEKRAKRKKPTPAQMKKQNQRNKERKVRYLINANFYPNDYWVTLKFQKGKRPPLGHVLQAFKNFRRSMQREYKKVGEAFKYIYRMEIGKRGGIHIHILMNRAGEAQTDLLVKKHWKSGAVNYQTLYEKGGYKNLAEYIVKEAEEEIRGQMSLFGEKEKRKLCTYGTSRNLVRPSPLRKTYTRRTVEKLVRDGPKPHEGYCIDRDSIYTGINPYTGYSYMYYTEMRIKPIMGREDGG